METGPATGRAEYGRGAGTPCPARPSGPGREARVRRGGREPPAAGFCGRPRRAVSGRSSGSGAGRRGSGWPTAAASRRSASAWRPSGRRAAFVPPHRCASAPDSHRVPSCGPPQDLAVGTGDALKIAEGGALSSAALTRWCERRKPAAGCQGPGGQESGVRGRGSGSGTRNRCGGTVAAALAAGRLLLTADCPLARGRAVRPHPASSCAASLPVASLHSRASRSRAASAAISR